MVFMESGLRRITIRDTPVKEVQTMQQPTDEIVWCFCEVCGLRIHPLHRNVLRTGVAAKTALN